VNRSRQFGFGAGMLLCGLLVAVGAWSEIAHRDGLWLVIASASVMPPVAALLARRAAREKSARLP
jgi:hypothetical protein